MCHVLKALHLGSSQNGGYIDIKRLICSSVNRGIYGYVTGGWDFSVTCNRRIYSNIFIGYIHGHEDWL
jgi:hypothetical protein